MPPSPSSPPPLPLAPQLVLYHILYCSLSFMGLRWNSFYFSIHLLDLVMSFKVLQTVLRSVLHNGKQVCGQHSTLAQVPTVGAVCI